VVTLSGFTHRYWDKDAAEQAAKRVYGAKGVANDIEVKPSSKRTDPDIVTQRLQDIRFGGGSVRSCTPNRASFLIRDRQRRNFLATLLLSQGVPMLCAGDEFGRTQGGNNNAYCQDNPVSWLSWEHDARAKSLLDFTRALIAQRRAHPIFRRPKFRTGTRHSEIR
jgi:hypothetical protein